MPLLYIFETSFHAPLIHVALTFWHRCGSPRCPPLPPSLWLACWWTAEAGSAPPAARGVQPTPAAQPRYNPESRSGSAWHPDGKTEEGGEERKNKSNRICSNKCNPVRFIVIMWRRTWINGLIQKCLLCWPKDTHPIVSWPQKSPNETLITMCIQYINTVLTELSKIIAKDNTVYRSGITLIWLPSFYLFEIWFMRRITFSVYLIWVLVIWDLT